MIGILSSLVFLVLQGVNAQLCFPEPVKNVTLTLDYTLHWEASANCEAAPSYLIFIHVDVDNLQYIYNTRNTYLNVSFLDACERFYFEVRASIQNELSEPTVLVSYVPAPSGADLTITDFTTSVQDGGATFLLWHVTEKFSHCARAFRLVIRDSANPIPRDIYTERNFLFLRDLIPCGRYEFGITAIYNLASEGPIHLTDYVAPQANASLPVLERVVTGDTFVNISWSLPSYSVNRCPITALVVDGLPFLHQLFPVNDSPERPIYTTTLSPLQPDNMYMLKVAIVNSAGTSEALPIGVQTLPAGSST